MAEPDDVRPATSTPESAVPPSAPHTPTPTPEGRGDEPAVEVQPAEVQPPPPPKIVAVIGEIPFAGAAVARELIKSGTTARVLCPDAESEAAVKSACATVTSCPAVLHCVRGNFDTETLNAIMAGAYGVAFVSPISLSGRFFRSETHLEDARRVAAAADAAGVRRVLYHSALGAQPVSPTLALSQAAAAEELFAAMDCDIYRLRTSVLMGRGDRFQSEMIAGAKSGSPVMNILGYGSTMMQPIHVDDLARCIARVFDNSRSAIAPGVLCVAGPEVTTPLDLTDLALARLGRLKLKIHTPLFVLKLLAAMRKDAAFREKVNLLFEGFCTDHNDTFRLLGASYQLVTPQQSQDEILAAAA